MRISPQEMMVLPLLDPPLAPHSFSRRTERIRHHSRDLSPPRSLSQRFLGRNPGKMPMLRMSSEHSALTSFALFLSTKRNRMATAFPDIEVPPALGLHRRNPGPSLLCHSPWSQYPQPQAQKMAKRSKMAFPGGVYFRSFGEIHATPRLLLTPPRPLGNLRKWPPVPQIANQGKEISYASDITA